MRKFTLALYVLASGAGLLLGQTTSTAILGTVADATGAVVSGAKVTATNIRTAVSREDITSGTGDYNFPLLDVGLYEVTVSIQGFKRETQKGIELKINEKVRVDFKLQVGQQTETVEVIASAGVLRTDEASLGQVVEQRRVVELPLPGRNLASLAVLQPGVQFGGRMGFDGQTGGGGGVPIPGAAISISANGQRDTNQHATLDGVVATEARVNTVAFVPSTEAIEEFKVLSGSYSAEYGTNSGAQLVIVTRSGSNQFHGSLFEFFRNDQLDAEDYFQNYFTAAGATRSTKNKLRQNQYGFVVSGPVLFPKLYNGKDKTFFMANWERRNRRQPGLIGRGNMPSAAFRNGDFGALLTRVPAVVITDPITGTPFPNNVIPSNRISATAKQLVDFWPQPQRVNADPLNGFNYEGEGGVRQDEDQVFLRADHNFSANDKVFARYAINDITFFRTPGDNPNFASFVTGRNQNLATQWLHLFSSNLINELRYGYNSSDDDTANPRTNTDFDLDTLGLTGFRLVTDGNRKFTPRETGLPSFNIQGFLGIGDRDGGNGFDRNKTHQINDSISWNRGSHYIKSGFDYRWISLYRGAANTARGTLAYNDSIAKNAFASFLLGYQSQSDTPEGLPLTEARQDRYAFYLTDDWKISRKLTLNLGVRWEYNTAATDIRGLWRTMSFEVLKNGYPTMVPNIHDRYDFYQPQRGMIMPRFGLAYRLSEKTVLRAGGGIYYNVHQLNNYTVLNLNAPLSGSSAFTQTADATGKLLNTATPLTFAQPFGALSPTSAIAANALDPKNPQGYVTQWSFDIQRQLPGRQVLSVGYVGNKGTNVDATVELNNPDPMLSSATPTNIQLRRPIQFIADGVDGPLRPLTRVRWLTAGNNSWYNALQVNYEKRMSKGLQFGAAYTYSQSLGEGYGRNEAFGGTSNTYQNPRDRLSEKGPYPFDVRQNLVVNFLYELPSPGAGAMKTVLGGWQVNGIWTLRTGFPYSVTQDGSLNTVGFVRPDRLADGTLSEPNIRRWFDVEAFRAVTCQFDDFRDRCHYGNAGSGILRGPDFNNMDMSLMKNFKWADRFNVQFRAEFFNLANSPNFGLPNRNLSASRAFLPVVPGGAEITQSGVAGGVGSITSLAAPMRSIQLGLKLIF